MGAFLLLLPPTLSLLVLASNLWLNRSQYARYKNKYKRGRVNRFHAQKVLPSHTRVVPRPDPRNQTAPAFRMTDKSCTTQVYNFASQTTPTNFNTILCGSGKVLENCYFNNLAPVGATVSYALPLGFLDLARRFGSYLVYGYRLKLTIVTPGTTVANPLRIVTIPHGRWTSAEATLYTAMSDSDKYDYLLCHPYATVTTIEGYGIRGRSTVIDRYISASEFFQLDQLEDLGDTESSSAYSGTLSVSDTGTTPAITNTIPSSTGSIYPDGGATGIQHALTDLMVILPSHRAAGFSTTQLIIDVEQTRYFYLYDQVPPQTDSYSVSGV